MAAAKRRPSTTDPGESDVNAAHGTSGRPPGGQMPVAGKRAAAGPPDDHAAREAELAERLRRALADLDNLRKRQLRQVAAEQAEERARVAAAWLPVVDNLELALGHADADPRSIVVGVRAVHDQAVRLLSALGYDRHEETGIPFDPVRHEAVGVVADPGTPPGTVVEVVRPGYGDPVRPLRPAAVVVADGA